jgi:hypothetical protein
VTCDDVQGHVRVRGKHQVRENGTTCGVGVHGAVVGRFSVADGAGHGALDDAFHLVAIDLPVDGDAQLAELRVDVA